MKRFFKKIRKFLKSRKIPSHFPTYLFENRKDDFKKAILLFYNKLKNGENFALSRWGDGELKILKGEAIDITRKEHGEFKYQPENREDERLRQILWQAFNYQHPDYYVGIGCPCCVGVEKFQWFKQNSHQSYESLTFANVFVNSNYDFFLKSFIDLLKDKKTVIVCNKKARLKKLPFKPVKVFRIGVNAWKSDFHLRDEISNWINSSNIENHIFLFCAGPLSNILVYTLFKEHPHNTYIDMGSALDPFLGLGFTRDYLRGGFTRRKICVFEDDVLKKEISLCSGPAFKRKKLLENCIRNNVMYFPDAKVFIATNDKSNEKLRLKLKNPVFVKRLFPNLGHQISCINAVIGSIKMATKKKGDVIIFAHEDCLIYDPLLLHRAVRKIISEGYRIVVREWITGEFKERHYGYDSYFVFDSFVIDFNTAQEIFGNLDVFKKKEDFNCKFAEEFFTQLIKEKIPPEKIFTIKYHHSTWHETELGFYHLPSKKEPLSWRWDRSNYDRIYG